jgi:glycosyltransferase involved in cell wall biosynthesis
MRIGISALLLTSEAGYRKAGICRYIDRVVDRMLALGQNHEFVLFYPKETTLPESWTSNTRLTAVPVEFGGRLSRVHWEHFRAKRLVKEHRLDVWFSTAQSIPFPCGCPRSVMIHDLIPVFFPQYFTREKAVYQRLANRYAMRNAESILANSETTKADMIAYMNFPGMAERITVTPLGPGNDLASTTCSEDAKAVLARIGVPFERYFFGLGTLEPRKNLPALFDAFAILERRGLDPGIGLVIGGGRGWMDGPIGERLRASGIEHRVHFPGYIDDADLSSFFACAEAFVFPSLYEGFGMPVLEAMIVGVPVLAACRSAMQEVGGDVAQYFDPESPQDLANLIEGSLANSDDRAARIQAGFERSKLFTWDRCASLTLAALEGLHA